jgi:LysM repeat protein
VHGDDWRRYVGPAAFLLAATIAIVLIRAGMNAGKSPSAGTTATIPAPPVRTVSTTTPTTKRTKTTTASEKQFWTVQAGDTFGVISAKSGVSVATIQRLNPKASSTTLFIGERLRIR